MFKKIFPLVMVLFAFSAKAQEVKYDKGGVQKYWIHNTDQTDLHLTFTNKSGATTGVVYNKLMVDWPKGWIVSFCDDLNCFAELYSSDTFAPIANNGVSELKISVYPQGKADTGMVQYEIFPVSNPASRDTVTVYVYIPWGASVNNLGLNSLQVYPSPASDAIAFKMKESGYCRVLDLNGRSIMEQIVKSGENTVDVSSLTNGVYFVQVTTSSGTFRKQFIKN